MKNIILLVFIASFFYNCKKNIDYIDDKILLINTNKENINFKKYVSNHKIKLIYFYNYNTCESCFLSQIPHLKKLTKKENFIIVTNLESQRELLSFKNNFEFKNVFMSKEDFFNKSFYLNVMKNEIVVPNTNIDNRDDINTFLKEFN